MISPHGGDVDAKVQQVIAISHAVQPDALSLDLLYSNSLTSWWERFFATKLLERQNYDEANVKIGIRKGLSASSL
jgi:hypothetical protein